MIGRRIFVLTSALIVGVQAKVNVEPSVAVVIRGGRAGEGSLGRICKAECIGLLTKLAATLVYEKQWSTRSHYDYVLTPVVAEVSEQSTRRVFQNSQPRDFCDVFECAVAAIPIKAIGQACRLANVEIVEAVVVDVGD